MANDWIKLAGLRERFLQGAGYGPDYWDAELLALYDRTFAERIRWKWQAVLKESAPRLLPLLPPAPLALVDFGCGTGAAVDTFLAHAPHAWSAVHLWDRSASAVEFTRRKLAEDFPDLALQTSLPEAGTPYFVLASHVVGELSERERKEFVALLKNSIGFILVEPGTSALGKEIVSLRERLRSDFQLLAPCPHQQRCALLDPGPHWCHHFAPPPDEVFRDSFWKEFSEKLKIDLRSLPVSYLVAARAPQLSQTPPARVIGRPRHYKGYSLALTCESSGVAEKKLLTRHHKALLKKWEKTQLTYELPEVLT